MLKSMSYPHDTRTDELHTLFYQDAKQQENLPLGNRFFFNLLFINDEIISNIPILHPQLIFSLNHSYYAFLDTF